MVVGVLWRCVGPGNSVGDDTGEAFGHGHDRVGIEAVDEVLGVVRQRDPRDAPGLARLSGLGPALVASD